MKKQVIDICKNYYDIISERYSKDEHLTKEILENYKMMTESSNIDPRLEKLDESVYAYFNDDRFREIITNTLNVDESLPDFLINQFELFKNNPANKIVTTKWI